MKLTKGLNFPLNYTRICFGSVILPVVVYGYETWLLTLREERRLRVFDNRVLRRIHGPKRDELTGEWRKLHMRSLMICTAHQILCGLSNQED